MKMRELEVRTGLNRETIRVYLRNGLVPEPVRPKHNVADYDESHVTAIIAVRDLQRDSGLTLNQIKNVLNGQQGACGNSGVDVCAWHASTLSRRGLLGGKDAGDHGLAVCRRGVVAWLAERHPARPGDA